MQFEEIADELFGLLPGEFTRARDELVAEARARGDRALADALKELRKPTTTAWVLNLLVRARRAEAERLLELGAALRAAQDELAGDELRRLSHERQQVVDGLVRQAGELAKAYGYPVSDAVLDEVGESLDAALAEPAAAAQLMTGRMRVAMARSGSALDVGRTSSASSRHRTTAGRAGEADLEGAQAARDYARAVRDREAAERELDVVKGNVTDAEHHLQTLRDAHQAATERLRAARTEEEQARRRVARPGARRR